MLAKKLKETQIDSPYSGVNKPPMLQLSETPAFSFGSLKFRRRALFFILLGAGLGCQDKSEALAQPLQKPASAQLAKTTVSMAVQPESQLGIADKGIFSDLDARLQLRLPSDLRASEVKATWDPDLDILVLYRADWPIKAYPTTGSRELRVDEQVLRLRPGDQEELKPLLKGKTLSRPAAGNRQVSDVDLDGIPDALDILVGAHKTVLNAASYGGGYKKIGYPWGEFPRNQGVCTDVVIRALRNAGVDLQSELQEDIKRKPSAYSMVKKRNSNIDHRRVKTLLPYFLRQWDPHTISLVDAGDPYRPGDVIFMDTFPNRSGPDHIGVVSNTLSESGLPLVVNNWTDGAVTAELDLLSWLPVTHRFRLRNRHPVDDK